VRSVAVVLVRVVVVLFGVDSSVVWAGGDSAAIDEPWVTFDAGRLGVSFEHPASMQTAGFTGFGSCTPDLTPKDPPERVPPMALFRRTSGTDGMSNRRPESGRQLHVAAWLGAADDGWETASLWIGVNNPAMDGFNANDGAVVAFTESHGVTGAGNQYLRRLAEDNTSVVYRVEGDRGRVVHLRGEIIDSIYGKPIREAELAAFDRLARSVEFFEPRSPETEPCGLPEEKWTRWHGAAWSVCVPNGWVESRWPDGQEPSQRVEPIPPTRLSFEEREQRFAMLMPEPWHGLWVPYEDRALVPLSIVSAATRGPYPAESDGEPVTAGTWVHAKSWLTEWVPTGGARCVAAGPFTNDAGQVGFLRVIESPLQMREDTDVGPLGRPEKYLAMRYTLYAPGRLEHAVMMSAYYDHAEARRVFDRVARSFILHADAVEPPADLPVIR